MKQSVLLLFFIATNLCLAQNKNEFQFKIQYNPETKYNQTMSQMSHMEMKYSGSPEMMQVLKDKKIQNPTITDNLSRNETIFKTGKLTDKTYFPLTIEFLKSTNSNDKIVIPNGTIIYGKGTLGNMPTLDSISSIGLSDEFKKNILQTMQSTFSQITIPERTVKVGDVFNIDTPLSIPIANMQLNMTITTTYKLLSIKNNIADFDFTQVYTMKTDNTKFPLNATGTGKGKLLYDVINNFNLKYQIDMEMDADAKIQQIELDIKTKSEIIQTAQISKND